MLWKAQNKVLKITVLRKAICVYYFEMTGYSEKKHF